MSTVVMVERSDFIVAVLFLDISWCVFGDGVKHSLVSEETRPLLSFWKVDLELGCGSPVFSALWSL
jgi:hypothetical protein